MLRFSCSVFILLLVALSCKTITEEAPLEKLLLLPADIPGIYNPTQLIRMGDNFAVLDEFGDKNFIKIFDKNFSPLKSFGELGEGPDQFADFPNMLLDYQGNLSLFDGIKNNLYSYDFKNHNLFKELLSATENEIIEELLSVEKDRISYQPGGFSYFVSSRNKIDGKVSDNIPISILNPHYHQLEESKKLNFSSSFISKHPTENSYAVALNYYDELIIYKKYKEHVHLKISDLFSYSDGITKIGFVSIHTTEDLIYTIYYGKSIEELDDPNSCSLLIYNWNGNQIRKIEFNQAITKFIITQDGTKLIGINPFNEDQPIFYGKLN